MRQLEKAVKLKLTNDRCDEYGFKLLMPKVVPNNWFQILEWP